MVNKIRRKIINLIGLLALNLAASMTPAREPFTELHPAEYALNKTRVLKYRFKPDDLADWVEANSYQITSISGISEIIITDFKKDGIIDEILQIERNVGAHRITRGREVIVKPDSDTFKHWQQILPLIDHYHSIEDKIIGEERPRGYDFTKKVTSIEIITTDTKRRFYQVRDKNNGYWNFETNITSPVLEKVTYVSPGRKVINIDKETREFKYLERELERIRTEYICQSAGIYPLLLPLEELRLFKEGKDSELIKRLREKKK